MAKEKESQYARKKRLAAEKAQREAAMANPFAAQEPEVINESLEEADDETSATTNEFAQAANPSSFAQPEGLNGDEDWLDDFDNQNVTAELASSGSGYEPITDNIFSFNYKDSNTVIVRPYPIMLSRDKSLSIFRSISTLINDPDGKADPIFEEISPRINGGRDEVLSRMLKVLNGDPNFRRQIVRTIDNKYFLCQILSNKTNPETVGKFALFRVSYSLNKLLTENGIIEEMNALVNPSGTRAIKIELTYDESREKKIEYTVSLQNYTVGQDKLVQTNSGTYITVGTDMNALKAWKAQFYAAFKDCKNEYNVLQTCDMTKFTPLMADTVEKRFRARYAEYNASLGVSAGTAAQSIANGNEPPMQAPNPFAVNPVNNPFATSSTAAQPTNNPFAAGNANAAPANNPFVSNMNNGASSNPFAASSKPGGFDDM